MMLASLPLVPRGGRGRKGRSVVFLVFLGMVADVCVTMHFKFQQFSGFLVPLLRNDRCHGFRRSCRFSGAAVEKPLALPQLQLVEKSVTFYEPLVFGSHFTLFGVRLWSTRVWIFREVTPGMVSVLNTPPFHIGHIYGVSLRCLLEEFPSYFNAIQQWIQVYASEYGGWFFW